MRVSDIDFLQFLPDKMKEDKDVVALAAAQNVFYKKIAEKIPAMSRWGKFRQMSEDELDLIAQDLYIPWYKITDSKEVKVSTLEHFIEVWLSLGTPKAIQTVIIDIYGMANLIEWFIDKENYKNGEFGIQVGNFAMLSQERKNRLFRILEIIKRKSQHFQTVYTVEKMGVDIYSGVRAVGLSTGVSSKIAGMYQPDVYVGVKKYMGCNVLVAKSDTSYVVAE